MTPQRKAAARDLLVELAAVALELEQHDEQRDRIAARRDEILLAARDQEPRPSLRDLAAIARVSHAWVRKLERREEARAAG